MWFSSRHHELLCADTYWRNFVHCTDFLMSYWSDLSSSPLETHSLLLLQCHLPVPMKISVFINYSADLMHNMMQWHTVRFTADVKVLELLNHCWLSYEELGVWLTTSSEEDLMCFLPIFLRIVIEIAFIFLPRLPGFSQFSAVDSPSACFIQKF